MMLLLAYSHERLLRRDVLAVAALIAIAAQIGRAASSPPTALADLVISVALVFSFRGWDDVMDCERDRDRHPQRVLVCARSTAPVAVASASAATLAAFGIWQVHGMSSLLLVGAFAGGLASWYAARGARSAAGDRLLLAKYGIFTLALVGADAVGWRALAAAAAVYVAACVHEWRHDRESRVFSAGGWS